MDAIEENEVIALQNGETFAEKTYSNEITITYERKRRLYYRVSETPPFHLCFLFALQQSIVSIPRCLFVVAVLAEIVCARDMEDIKAKMFATTAFLAGLTTFFQNTIGIRLPLYQGPLTQYALSLLALTSLPEWSCPKSPFSATGNASLRHMNNLTEEATKEEFVNAHVLPKIQVGSLALAGLIHMLFGLSGVLHFVMRFIGPLAIVPTLLLALLRYYTVITNFCDPHWGVAATTMFLSLVLSLFLDGKRMPIPIWTRQKGFHIIRYPLQQVLSILIAMGVGWIMSYILTVYNVLDSSRDSKEFYARTDTRMNAIHSSPWLYIPYPGLYVRSTAKVIYGREKLRKKEKQGQFGPSSFKFGIFMSFMVPTMISILDSIADYYACAKTVLVPTPPKHAINRGIAIEGLFSLIAGFFGAGHATTTYGGNIGIIGMTKVGSRRVFQYFALQIIFVSIIGKFAAFFVTIPYPVLGGSQVISSGIFIGLVLSNLNYVDITSTRNLSVVGISVLLGLMVPTWFEQNTHVLSTGSKEADDALLILMTNPTLFGSIVACILDNTLPGTLESRGMIAWQADGGLTLDPDQFEEGPELYDIPPLTRFLKRFRWSKYIPIFPTFKKE